MSKKNTNNKATKDRLFKQMSAKKRVKDTKKAIDLSKQPVTRGELYGVQSTINTRADSALMGTAAIVELLVKNKICTYEEFSETQKSMLEILAFIRQSMREAHKKLGPNADPEDTGAFIYEKAVVFGVDKDLLINIFGVRPTKNRILKPNQVKSGIITK